LTAAEPGDNVVGVSNQPQDSRSPLVPEDLDKLRDDLAEARKIRERKEREFEQFVRAFREAPAPPPEPRPRRLATPVADPAQYPSRPAPRSGRRVPAVAAVAIAAVVLLAWAWWPVGEVEAPGPESSAPASSAVTPDPQPAPPPAAAPAQPPAALNVEIATERVVWMRVTVDGRQLFEREVPAGEKIPLRADSRIVVRAGDAGGVRLIVNGRDEGVLGADGQVVTRTLNAPGAPQSR
jgi:hypothetical protein